MEAAVPNEVPECNDCLLVFDVNSMLGVKLYDDARLVLAAAEHDSARNHGVSTDRAFLGKRDMLLSGTEDDDIILASSAARRFSVGVHNIQ